MHASTALTGDGSRTVLLPVVERDPIDHRVVLNTLLAKWAGSDAIRFWESNQDQLRAGRPLRLTLDRLRGGNDGQWWGVVTRCELAPVAPSWQKRADTNDQAAA